MGSLRAPCSGVCSKSLPAEGAHALSSSLLQDPPLLPFSLAPTAVQYQSHHASWSEK